MASSSPIRTLTFGIEIELLVKPTKALLEFLKKTRWDPNIPSQTEPEPKDDERWKSSRQQNRDSLRWALAQALTEEGFQTGTHTIDYRDWTIKDEPSLTERTGYCERISSRCEFEEV